MDGHGGSTVCYTNSFTLYMCRFYTSQQTGWVRWCGWRAQSEGRCNKVNSKETLVWCHDCLDFFLHWRQHTALSSVNISPQSAPHVMQEKEHKYKTRAPRVQLPPKGEGYTETLFHEVFIPTCWCQPVFLTVSWHQPVVASLWRCKRHVEKIKSLLHSSLRALSYDILLDMVFWLFFSSSTLGTKVNCSAKYSCPPRASILLHTMG